MMTQSTSAVQGGRRKRTDLLPTMPVHRADGDRSPRSPHYSASSSSRGSVSRSTGMSFSMSRLDQLARPRQRTQSQNPLLPSLHENGPLESTPAPRTKASTAPPRPDRSRLHGGTTPARPAARHHSMSKSMSHLVPTRSGGGGGHLGAIDDHDHSAGPHAKLTSTSATMAPRTTRAERLRQKARLASSSASASATTSPAGATATASQRAAHGGFRKNARVV